MKVFMTFCALVSAIIVADSDVMAGNKINNANQGKELKVGDPAPNWKLTGSDGKVYQLSDFKGKKAVVVSWYPMALTGG
jgi:peroxiredoxin